MVDRGRLDTDLLQLAVERGLKLYQPAKFESCIRQEDAWYIEINREHDKHHLISTFILDARGRKAGGMQDKLLTAPTGMALFANTTAASMPNQTLVEALADGWLWGSPLPDKQFRMMAFVSPEMLRHASIEQVFSEKITGSVLFKYGMEQLSKAAIQTCSVLHYAHNNPWQDGYIRLGEAAFTLDPLSSTGVEKAMRLSLQAVIAVNTVLRSGDTAMAQSFYEDRMMESVLTHQTWTANYYSMAWPAQHAVFWQERSAAAIRYNGSPTAFSAKLLERSAITPPSYEPPQSSTGLPFSEAVNALWHKGICISPETTYHPIPCVVNDYLELKQAIAHPSLEREIAYIGETAIEPLLSSIKGPLTFADLMYQWSQQMPFEQAAGIGIWLCHLGILTAS